MRFVLNVAALGACATASASLLPPQAPSSSFYGTLYMNAMNPIPATTSEFTPPGRLVVEDGRPRWEGPLTWSRNHGSHARTTWLAGKISGVVGALLPDGSRSHILKQGAPETGGWRRANDDGSWTHGTLAVADDDIRFIDDLEQPKSPRWQHGSLPAVLARSPQVIEAVADRDFADDLYGALCSIGWRDAATGKEYWGTWSRAARLVASLRGRGECYTDFFLLGNEGVLVEKVDDLLYGLGWGNIGGVDPDSRARRAIRIVETCEARPVAQTPEWYRLWANGLSYETKLDSRMHVCALAGQATLEEWDLFWEYFGVAAE